MSPIYSYDPNTSGPGGSPGSMVMSIACAEGRCGECDAWFRCDHEHHRLCALVSPPALVAALDQMETTPGISRDELPGITEGILSLAAFDRLADEIGSAPLSVNPYCDCPACCQARAEPVPPEGS